MTIDWLKTADFFQEELQAFYQVFRRGGGEVELRAAMKRLRAALDQVESMVNDLDDKWGGLAAEQRWGYLRVLSHLGTATHELKRLDGYAVKRPPTRNTPGCFL